MAYRKSPTRPLSRGMTALLVLVVLTAFLPHRERALLLTRDNMDGMLASQLLENSRFAPPIAWDRLFGNDWGSPTFAALDPLRRERSGPARPAFTNRLPGAVPTTTTATVPTLIPLGTDVPGGAPVLSSPAPTNPGGGGSGGSGPVGGFPGGGGGGGGGGSITNPAPPVTPPAPPVGVVPEPATWAMMILGFGLIGSALRRAGRRVRYVA